jgi:hypothetical protein
MFAGSTLCRGFKRVTGLAGKLLLLKPLRRNQQPPRSWRVDGRTGYLWSATQDPCPGSSRRRREWRRFLVLPLPRVSDGYTVYIEQPPTKSLGLIPPLALASALAFASVSLRPKDKAKPILVQTAK